MSRKDYIASSARLALKNLGGHRRLVESRRSDFKDGLFSFYGHLSFYSLRFSLLDLRTAHTMVVAASLLFLVCPKKVAHLAVGKSRSEINYIYLFLDQAGN